MEFHNIFGCAHGESKLRDNTTRGTCSNFQTKAILEKQEIRQQKIEHNMMKGPEANNLPVHELFGFCTGFLSKEPVGNYFVGNPSK